MGGSSRLSRPFLLLTLAAIAALTLARCIAPISFSPGMGTPVVGGHGSASPGKGNLVSSYHGCGLSAAEPDVYYLCAYHVLRLPHAAFAGAEYTLSPAAPPNCTQVLVGPQSANIQDLTHILYNVRGQKEGADSEVTLIGLIQMSLSGEGSCDRDVLHLTIHQVWSSGQAELAVNCLVKTCTAPSRVIVTVEGPTQTSFAMDVPLQEAFSGGVTQAFPLQAPGTGRFVFIFSRLLAPLPTASQ